MLFTIALHFKKAGAQNYGEKLTRKYLKQFEMIDTTDEGFLVCSKGGKETKKFLSYYPKEVLYFYAPQKTRRGHIKAYKLMMLMYVLDYYCVKQELIKLLGTPLEREGQLIWYNGKEQITYIVRPQALRKEEDYAIFVHLK
ncbi:MAG: hypothetical protein RML72_11605 [Bacteroidia bacterium]|nr:hypothetical protein [Bacteroidia bacterium]MDW8159502.1 hypothetical protein [Bacteroidia bacterium]